MLVPSKLPKRFLFIVLIVLLFLAFSSSLKTPAAKTPGQDSFFVFSSFQKTVHLLKTEITGSVQTLADIFEIPIGTQGNKPPPVPVGTDRRDVIPSTPPIPLSTVSSWTLKGGALTADLPDATKWGWAYQPSLAASGGKLYAAWAQHTNPDKAGGTGIGDNWDYSSIYVKEWNGTSWVPLGGRIWRPGFNSSNPLGSTVKPKWPEAFAPSVAVVGGVPYVAWYEGGGYGWGLADWSIGTSVFVAHWDGSKWVLDPNAALPQHGALNTNVHNDARNPKLGVIGGVLHAAFIEVDTTTGKAKSRVAVKRLDAGVWSDVGSKFAVGTTVKSRINDVAIAEVAGTPYAVWSEYTHTGDVVNGPATIQVFKFSGGTWQQVGTGALNITPGSDANYVGIAVLDSVPYVVWQEKIESGNYQIYVKHWNGISWMQDGGTLNLETTAEAGRPTLASDGTTLWLSWTEGPAGVKSKIYVRSFTGGSWSSVEGGLNVDLVNGAPDTPGLALVNNVPYLIWSEKDFNSWTKHVYVKARESGTNPPPPVRLPFGPDLGPTGTLNTLPSCAPHTDPVTCLNNNKNTWIKMNPGGIATNRVGIADEGEASFKYVPALKKVLLMGKYHARLLGNAEDQNALLTYDFRKNRWDLFEVTEAAGSEWLPGVGHDEGHISIDTIHNLYLTRGNLTLNNLASFQTYVYDLLAGRGKRMIPAKEPPPVGGGATYDPDHDLMLDIVSQGSSSWLYNHNVNTWEVAPLSCAPPGGCPTARAKPGMVYDTKNHIFLMFGGSSGAVSNNELWTFDAAPGIRKWTKKNPGLSPQPLISPFVAFDSVNGVMLLMGGGTVDSNTLSKEVWAYDAALGPEGTWTRLADVPASLASDLGRPGFYLTYDSDDGVFLSYPDMDISRVWAFKYVPGPPLPDTTPPLRSNGKPTGTLPAGTVSATLGTDTNENATCKYGATAGVAYDSIPNNFSTTGAKSHSSTISGLTDGTTYNYYVRCKDTAGNANSDDYNITFSVAAAGANGAVRIKRVGASETTTDAPSTSAWLDSGAPVTTNPLHLSPVGIGSHTAYATDVAGYTETAGTCTYPVGGTECTISTFPITPTCDGTSCSVSITVTTNQVTKVVMKYVTETTTPVLDVSPASLSFSANQNGSDPAPQNIAITNTGGGTMNWTVSDDAAWLSLSPTTGTNNGTVTASVSISGLAVGTYTAAITVTAPGATGSPKTVSVTLTVSIPPPTGSLITPLIIQEALPYNFTGLNRNSEPITAGIPLAEDSGITNINQLGLSGTDQGQFRVLARWPNGNIKWVLVDTQASVPAGGTNNAVSLTTGSGNFGGLNLAADNGAMITVNTGPAQFEVKKANFDIFRNVVVNGQILVDPAALHQGLVLRAFSVNDPQQRIEIKSDTLAWRNKHIHPGVLTGQYRWYYTFVSVSGKETGLSVPSHKIKLTNNSIDLDILSSPEEGIVKRRLYRAKFNDDASVIYAPRLVMEVSGNSVTPITDNTPDDALGGEAPAQNQHEEVEFSSVNDASSKVMVEENGPMRTVLKAEGSFNEAAGKHLADYTLRLHFYKGKSSVKAYVTLRNADKDYPRHLLFTSLEADVPLNLDSAKTVKFARKTDVATANLAAGETAYLYQGYSKDNWRGDTRSCINWDPPVPGTCPESAGTGGNDYIYDLTQAGLEVKVGDTKLNSLGSEQDWTQGFAEMSDSSGKGVTVALRWMSSYWPAGFEFKSDGSAGIELFSKHNPKKRLKMGFGKHESREIAWDFHSAPVDNQLALYRLQYPLIARAPLDHYRETRALYGEPNLASVEEFNKYFTDFLGKPAYKLGGIDRPMAVTRVYGWGNPNEQLDHAHDFFLDFLRSGKGMLYLRGEQRAQFNDNTAVVHSDDYSYEDLNLPDNIDPDRSSQGPSDTINGIFYDMEHSHILGLPMYYYLTGDEHVRQSVLDYGEFLDRTQTKKSFATLPNNEYFRSLLRKLKNFAIVYEFTCYDSGGCNTRYQPIVEQTINKLLDSRDNPSLLLDSPHGRNMDRGYMYWGKGRSKDIGFRAIHNLFDEYIHPEAIWEVLRIMKDTGWSYPRQEDMEDYLSGIAQFAFQEMYHEKNNVLTIHDVGYRYDHAIDVDPDTTILEGRPSVNIYQPFTSSRLWLLGYQATANPLYLKRAGNVLWAHMTSDGVHMGTELQSQALMRAYSHPPPTWQKIEDLTAQDLGGGSYRLRWTVPADTARYQIKYADKPVVDWLGFDGKTRTFTYSPANYRAFFAASNIANEPPPGSAGSIQEVTLTGLPAAGLHFAIKYLSGTPPPPPVFNFSLTNSGNISVTQGSSVTNTISATLLSGTTESVTFSVSGLPTGATPTFAQTSCNPTCSTTLTIATLASTPTGTYTVTVTGTAGALSKTTSFSLTVNTPDTTPPTRSNGKPTGTLPAGTVSATLSADTDENATCKYGATAGATYDSLPNTFSTTGAKSHSSIITGLTNGATYHYYVRCKDTAGNANIDDYNVTFSVAATGANGAVRIKRVGEDDTVSSVPPGTEAWVDTTGTHQSANPADFSPVSAGSHIAHATNISGYAVTAGICTYPVGGSECVLTTFSLTPACNGIFCNVSITVAQNTVTKVVFKYVSATLVVSLTAVPDSGVAPLTGVDLTAAVSGTAMGPVNYTFYCNRTDNGTDITLGFDAQFLGETVTTKTAVNACGYATAGTYTAKIIVERGGVRAEQRAPVIVVEELRLFDIEATSTATSAIISWATNREAFSAVDYGLNTSDYIFHTATSTTATTSHSFLLSNLIPDTRYHYRVKSKDSFGTEKVSGNLTFRTKPLGSTDTTKPAPIGDLTIVGRASHKIILTWTATGDDGNVGQATGYDIRYRTDGVITDSNWNTATSVPQTLVPKEAGKPEHYKISDLIPQTAYSIAIRASDEAGNISDLSNVVTASTRAKPPKPKVTTFKLGSVELAWELDPYNDGPLYSLLIKNTSPLASTTDSAATILVNDTSTVSYSDTAVEPGKTYYYGLSSYINPTDEEYSEMIVLTVTIPSPPAGDGGGGGGGSSSPPPTPSSQPAASVPPRLLKRAGGLEIYVLRMHGGRQVRQWVPSPDLFALRGYRWDAVEEVSAAELQRYPRVSLERAAGDFRVYYITESGLKRHIPSVEVFNSYGNRWEDVVEVDAAELEVIPESILIFRPGNPRIYKLEEGRKRWIVNPDAFRRAGFGWSRVAPVNQVELDAYPVGANIR